MVSLSNRPLREDWCHHAEALGIFDLHLAALEEAGDRPAPAILELRARLLDRGRRTAILGDLDKIRAAIEQARAAEPLVDDTVLPIDANGERMTAYRWLPEVIDALDDHHLAAWLLPKVRAHRGQLLVGAEPSLVWGAADRAIGQLLMVLGSFEEAEEYFRQAVTLEETVRSRPLAARSRLAWASMYSRWGRRADHERKRSLALRVAAEADALGMRKVARSAALLLR